MSSLLSLRQILLVNECAKREQYWWPVFEGDGNTYGHGYSIHTIDWSVDDSKIDKINMIPFQNKKRIRSTWFMTTLTSSRIFLFFRKWLNCRSSLLYLLSHQKTNPYQSTILLKKKKKRYWSPLWWTSPNTKLGGYILYTVLMLLSLNMYCNNNIPSWIIQNSWCSYVRNLGG